MGLFFKHTAVRLWTALVLGSLATLVALPPLAGSLGPAWMIGPAVGLLVVAYWLVGITFAFVGRRRFDRLLEEARVWERAGMEREARQTLSRAEAIVDSFLFSPFSRRRPAGRLLASQARFRMAQGQAHVSSDAVVAAYLRQAPQDREAAVQWLADISADGDATASTHDIAVRIGRAHPDDPVVQQRLAHFYISQRRCDFAALQTYAQVVDTGLPLPEGLIDDLAEIFLSERRTDRLALKVFLRAHQGGLTGNRLFAGIAACCRDIPAGPVTCDLLQSGRRLLNHMNLSQRAELANDYLPDAADAIQQGKHRFRPTRRLHIAPLLRRGFSALTGIGAAAAVRMARLRKFFTSPQGRSRLKWAGITLSLIAVGWMAVSTAIYLAATFKTVEPVTSVETQTITDPFTLQVAAYLKETDARRYVEQLISHGLDAYWTRAVGTNKTWYQVRISHFATKAQAREVGEDLKTRRLIGDYYIANYKRPDVF